MLYKDYMERNGLFSVVLIFWTDGSRKFQINNHSVLLVSTELTNTNSIRDVQVDGYVYLGNFLYGNEYFMSPQNKYYQISFLE